MLRPTILLVGQSESGKSKFISQFIHNDLKGFLPIRREGQTTRVSTVYSIKPYSSEKVEYSINFASALSVKQIFEEKFVRSIKKIMQEANEIPNLASEDYVQNYDYNKIDRKYTEVEEEKRFSFLN